MESIPDYWPHETLYRNHLSRALQLGEVAHQVPVPRVEPPAVHCPDGPDSRGRLPARFVARPL